ncbi:Molybdate-anion transporter [Entophlyctis luteolus]|nr:Molybdate-anion transporter [Entophlyctis luteolus]
MLRQISTVADETYVYFSRYLLAFGRVLGGVSTSLLFSVFEAWMVSEHYSRGFADADLGATFATATFGNGVVAIASGVLANAVVTQFGLVAPFGLAIVFFAAAAAVVCATWGENYGQTEKTEKCEKSGYFGSLMASMSLILNDYRMFATGMTQSLYEGAMYTFIFMWGVSLETISAKNETAVPYGIVFAAFMVSTMLGSCIFTAFREGCPRLGLKKVEPEGILLLSLILGASSFIGIILFGVSVSDCENILLITIQKHVEMLLFASFNLFEFSVGLYFPAIGTVRSMYIPEKVRSSVLNVFRIPLNLIVVIVLFKVCESPFAGLISSRKTSDLSEKFIWTICVFLLISTIGLQVSVKVWEKAEYTALSDGKSL